MDISRFVKEEEMLVSPCDRYLQYSGRIGKSEDGDPKMIFSCSYVKLCFSGSAAAIVVSSKRFYWNVFAGAIVDGKQVSFELPEDDTVRIELGNGLSEGEHEITFFKRQDACNTITVRGFILKKGSQLLECPDKPKRRIEVYGDSVSAGEVSEAVDCVGKPDPAGHEGRYSNCWYSYAWMTARNLNAEIYNMGQGGIALQPKTGWFGPGPDYIGLEQIYDKVEYYPDLDKATTWDFSLYTPHVVIVAIGQNDANPVNFMMEDYDSDKSVNWRKRYREFVLRLRGLYPNALIICQTTVLCHDESWDRAIDEVVNSIADDKVKHLLYKQNGKATPGHPRIPEAEMMAEELTAYIESFGEDIWK